MKTVFFLGSGFSKCAGGLVQKEIIRTILEEGFTQGKENLIKAKQNFVNFMKKELHIPEERYCTVQLEDIFTPIDGCITNGMSYGNYSSKELEELREQFNALMGEALEYSFKKNKANCDYVNEFANYINDLAKSRTDDDVDRVSIITTNWDIIFDQALKQSIEDSHPDKLSVVDYCCYVSSWMANDLSIKPGQLAVGNGGYNIKLLKLHGSMNWFQCPLCQRMYVRFGDLEMMKAAYCRHCKKNYKMQDSNSIKLQSNLLLPTYLKNLSNIQIKVVWQNAAIELSEASKIVFIGYSLPDADFEIRQLFSRMIRPDAEIQVVIYPYGSHVEAEEERYKDFFGSRLADKNILKVTVPEYVESLRKK